MGSSALLVLGWYAISTIDSSDSCAKAQEFALGIIGDASRIHGNRVDGCQTVFVRMGCPHLYQAIIRSANRCARSAGRCASPRTLYVY